MNKNINLNLYTYFYAVAKYGTLSKASEYTYVSIPAISKSIKLLEEQLNRQLFYRNRNGMELTSEGRELYKYVKDSFDSLSKAERNLLELDNLEKGVLSIGMPSNIGSFFMFDKIFDYHDKYPNIEITIVTGGTSKLISLLKNHEVDFVIDTSPINIKLDEDTIIKKLDTVYYSFISNTNKDYSSIKSIKDLEKEELVLPIKNTANRIDIDRLFKKNNVNNIKCINLHTSEMIISAVKNGLGIGYVISNLVKNDKDIKILDIKEQLPSVDILLIYNEEYLTHAPKTFINEYINKDINI